MRKLNDIQKQKIKTFLSAAENKSAITILLTILFYIFLLAVTPNFWFRLIGYFLFYFVIQKVYDYILKILFR